MEDNNKEISEFKIAWGRFLRFATFVLTVTSLGLQLFPSFYDKVSNTGYIREFNTTQALEDFDFMWNELEDNYSFFDEIQDEGLDYKEINKKYRDKIKNEDKINIRKFYLIVKDNLNEYKNIGNLDLVSKEYYSAMNKLNIYRIISNENYYSNFSDAINSEKPEKTYFYLGMDNLIKYFRIRQDFSEDRGGSTGYQHSKDTFVLDVKNPSQILDSLTYKNDISGFYSNDFKSIKNIILKLDDKFSESNDYWIRHIVAPLITQEKNLNLKVLTRDGEIAKSRIQKLELNAEEIPNGNLIYLNTKVMPERPIDFKGDIYLLVDENSANALENFAMFCKETGFATVVGRPTSGNPLDGLGYPRLSILPNSGLLFQYKLGKMIDKNGNDITREGVKPDILIKDGESIFKETLKYLGESENRDYNPEKQN